MSSGSYAYVAGIFATPSTGDIIHEWLPVREVKFWTSYSIRSMNVSRSDVAGRIASLRAGPHIQKRLDDLAKKNSAGRLTPREEVEYSAFVEALDVMAILQAKARSAAMG